jgi:hypothetical protein
MLRFQLDIPVMVKRWRKEWGIHGRDFGKCHCGKGMGTMRKHRPLESHPSSSCRICSVQRHTEKMDRRRERYEGKKVIADQLTEVEGPDPYGPSGPLFNEEEYEMKIINWYLDMEKQELYELLKDTQEQIYSLLKQNESPGQREVLSRLKLKESNLMDSIEIMKGYNKGR